MIHIFNDLNFTTMKNFLLINSLLFLSIAVFATEHHVRIEGFAFSPATLTIEVGDIVTWTNFDGAPHTASSTAVPSGAATFDSGNLSNGGSYSFTFTTAGDYAYWCDFHANMEASITVDAPLGISDIAFQNLEIYPNPVSKQTVIKGLNEVASYSIFNTAGHLVATGSVAELNFELLETGAYFVRFELEGDKSKTIRIVKN